MKKWILNFLLIVICSSVVIGCFGMKNTKKLTRTQQAALQIMNEDAQNRPAQTHQNSAAFDAIVERTRTLKTLKEKIDTQLKEDPLSLDQLITQEQNNLEEPDSYVQTFKIKYLDLLLKKAEIQPLRGQLEANDALATFNELAKEFFKTYQFIFNATKVDEALQNEIPSLNASQKKSTTHNTTPTTSAPQPSWFSRNSWWIKPTIVVTAIGSCFAYYFWKQKK